MDRVWWDCPKPGYVETEPEDQTRRYIDTRETEMAQKTARWIKRVDWEAEGTASSSWRSILGGHAD